MNQQGFIHDFSVLGTQITAWLHNEKTHPALSVAMQKSTEANNWFTAGTIRTSLSAIATGFLDEKKLRRWLEDYPAVITPEKVGVVMAGNIPLVGFHDFLCVLAAGHFFIGKLSHKDVFLLPALAGMLYGINPEWRHRICFVEEMDVTKIDKLIATGSDQTAHYFKTLTAHSPLGNPAKILIRHNRRSIAVLSGNETAEELSGLADDMLLYFGLGCRNVSTLFVPAGYDWGALKNSVSSRKELLLNKGYAHNYRYQKAILAMQVQSFIDMETVLLLENESLQAPPAVVHFQFYNEPGAVFRSIEKQREQIQCIVGSAAVSNIFCTFGQAQQPQLGDYADGVDTMQWLLST